ncbi:MAG TPA: protein-tyrosine-phosphatase [Stellaceae bacterium]|nr:protein-tyrosine-phosphatase [Stellaceae bacterium]
MEHDALNFRITICGIPELGLHCAAGVTHVLSIHDPDLADPPDFADFAPHRRLGLRFNDIIEPTPGQVVPSRDDVENLLAFGREFSGTPNGHLLVHCHAGVSRSTASAALILAQAMPERSASEIFDAIVKLRPRAWPNLRIIEFGDALLGRGGEFVAAVGGVYQRVLKRDPWFEDEMIEGGRQREVLAAINWSAPGRSGR